MNIRHECPHSELSFAVSAPLRLVLRNGETVTVKKWSLSGLWVDEGLPDIQDLALSIPFQGVDVTFPINLTAAEDGHYAFKDLTVRQRETLSAFYQGVMTGRMVSTGDMISSLDTPVDLVPMSETDAEKTAGLAKERPRALRVLWNVTYYLLLIATLGGFLGTQIWSRLSYVNLQHARFVAPITEYVAPESGHVSRFYVREGDQVRTGEILVRIEDPDRESDVEEVRAEVLLAERRLRDAQEAYTTELLTSQQYGARLQARFARLRDPWRILNPTPRAYPAHIQSAWLDVQAFARGEDTPNSNFFALLANLKETVTDRELDLRRWKRELRHRKAAADELIIRARSPGTVQHIHVVRNSAVQRGELIIEVEANTAREAVAWLDEKFAASVHVGMPADIAYSFRGEAKRVAGRVVDIQAGTDVSKPDDFGIILTIKADDVGVSNSRKWFHRNGPAKIKLDRSDRLRFWDGWFDGRA